MGNTERIKQLNDEYRAQLGRGAQAVETQGIRALSFPARLAISKQVREFSAFGKEDDPYAEHDFGSFAHDGNTVFWKIDYYDHTFEFGSEDPADPRITHRVLTVMLAEEY
jgi:hypothetical protein